MATLFSRSFEAVTETASAFNASGEYVRGGFSARKVRGTVQPVTGQETVPSVVLSRNTGTVKIYSSERLEFRREGGDRCYVRHGSDIYEVVDEAIYQNALIPHYRYYACMVPPSQVPEGLK